MKHELPELPYPKNALEPHMSQETLEYHHDKHHKAYVDKTNELIQGTEFENMPLEDLIKKASGTLFNQSAQIWNHTFFWSCLSPNGGGEPSGELADAIKQSFGSFDNFKKEFTDKTIANFASGWGWLVKKKSDGSLAIVETDDAETPLTDASVVPLLTCDIWEHAYYIDYRNARPKYLEAFWNLVNWDFVAANFKK
ncbi:superoxide dismutase [Fe] [Alkalilimnicola ehrlichii]|uniref:Superoxide dismutase n=1 Tax=Alkalilimnicola ehrlichii TaxID=351052 RepID=A0A3E0WHH3_9GAMM|nr:Fe-Mn family superoxide dismutase [Alkalilimnicola ehrlichii]RFA24601.1 superoxide dismutase [Fe] [Alkalilimnicola ehrlichii]RFA31683.1 superoxide dismutase [Fe] [Alkalilimnicola ehrlichii]